MPTSLGWSEFIIAPKLSWFSFAWQVSIKFLLSLFLSKQVFLLGVRNIRFPPLRPTKERGIDNRIQLQGNNKSAANIFFTSNKTIPLGSWNFRCIFCIISGCFIWFSMSILHTNRHRNFFYQTWNQSDNHPLEILQILNEAELKVIQNPKQNSIFHK